MRVKQFIQTSAMVAALAALPVFAQTSSDPNSGTGNPPAATSTQPGAATAPNATNPTDTTGMNNPSDRDNNNRHDYGWLGLVGLAGLLGLRHRSRMNDRLDDTRNTPGTMNRMS